MPASSDRQNNMVSDLHWPDGWVVVLLLSGNTPLRMTGKLLTLARLTLCLALVVPWRKLGIRFKL